MAKYKNLPDMFTMKLQALYDIETHLVKALPKMAKAAMDPVLKAAFTDHLAETKEHVVRLQEAFAILGEKKKKLTVDAIRGLTADAGWCIAHVEKGNALDAALIGAARYVEHYEMAGYLAALEWSDILEQKPVMALLEKTLAEEEGADDILAELGITIAARLV